MKLNQLGWTNINNFHKTNIAYMYKLKGDWNDNIRSVFSCYTVQYWESWIQISTQKPAVLIMAYHGSPQSLKVNAVIVCQTWVTTTSLPIH
jgi:hypothetical protein